MNIMRVNSDCLPRFVQAFYHALGRCTLALLFTSVLGFILGLFRVECLRCLSSSVLGCHQTDFVYGPPSRRSFAETLISCRTAHNVSLMEFFQFDAVIQREYFLIFVPRAGDIVLRERRFSPSGRFENSSHVLVHSCTKAQFYDPRIP